MIGRTNAGGGGGGGLNFRVIGGTSAPTNPKENDIWVNTSTNITNWAFAIEEPTSDQKTVNFVTATADSYIDSAGSVTYYPDSDITDYIELPENTKRITTTCCDIETANTSHAFYTADKTFISAVLRETGTTTYEVPNGAVYVRLSIYGNSSVSDSMSFVATIGMEEGFVWFSTGAFSDAEFNALRKNGVQVYPVSTKQCVSGAWVSVPALIYQGSAWVEVVTHLFKDGTVNMALVGDINGTNDDGALYYYTTLDRSTNASYTTAQKVNLDHVNSIHIRFMSTATTNSVYCRAFVSTSAYDGNNVATSSLAAYAVSESPFNSEERELVLDVSSLSGDYYIGYAWGVLSSASGSRTVRGYIYEWWLE